MPIGGVPTSFFIWIFSTNETSLALTVGCPRYAPDDAHLRVVPGSRFKFFYGGCGFLPRDVVVNFKNNAIGRVGDNNIGGVTFTLRGRSFIARRNLGSGVSPLNNEGDIRGHVGGDLPGTNTGGTPRVYKTAGVCCV